MYLNKYVEMMFDDIKCKKQTNNAIYVKRFYTNADCWSSGLLSPEPKEMLGRAQGGGIGFNLAKLVLN